MSIVKQARNAFVSQDYHSSLALYEEASRLIGPKFFEANVKICRKNLRKKNQQNEYLTAIKPTHSAEGLRYADQFKVALVADEFTTNSFANEFQTIAVEPDNWLDLFIENRPDIFFCESAWSGPDGKVRPWKGRVYASKNFPRENRTALLDILKYCRENHIPTVFWNKEDPTHHNDKVHDFVKSAQEFDYVFTTAAECIDSYKNTYKIKNTFALPFATNPKLFNPIDLGNRSNNVIFAGSWYANHLERSADMSKILSKILDGGFTLEIYDRYYGDSDPLHQWPEDYKPYLLPSKPHSEMPQVYKSGLFGLNINTVTNSSTMFARRVFELMSSNTLVISNESVGTREMFDDLIIYPELEKSRLRSLSSADIADLRARALKKVLSEHTYTERWHTILEKIGIPFAKRTSSLTFVSLVSGRDDALSAIGWFQQYGASIPEAAILIVAAESLPHLETAELYKEFNRFGVAITSFNHASRYAFPGRYNPIETTHFMEINTSLPMKTDYIKDCLLHLKYMEDYPLALADTENTRYKILPISDKTLVIRPAEKFKSWLVHGNGQELGYHL